ncbi:hypothetical protein [Rhodopila sp.]|uniref:hypothetical protein n=1 Tax=Rhodopila sp. TaxID=2480087 RepID=UPI003D1360F9
MPALAVTSILAPFQQQLVGNWRNLDFGEDATGKPVGGDENPLSYNIMPLPQTSDPDGYILKNFTFHERLHFNNDKVRETLAVSARAPNRGGQVNQDARALFYAQQVMFAEGPGKGTIVHVENGAWLYFPRYIQQPGPYPANPPGSLVSNALQQPPDSLIAKQISVPHGNSVLALGRIETVPGQNGAGPWNGNPTIAGSPIIPDGVPPYPVPAEPVPLPVGDPIPRELQSNLNADQRYGTVRTSSSTDPNDFENPNPDFTLNPNLPLQRAVNIIKPEAFMHWSVTTRPLTNGEDGRGSVTNIPFEQLAASVIAYAADYWLLFKADKKYLTYTQTILLVLTVKGRKYTFPHVTGNTVTYTG